MSGLTKNRIQLFLSAVILVAMGALGSGCSEQQALNVQDDGLTEPVITLDITGGFAGVNRSLNIFQDGRVEYKSLSLNQGAFNKSISSEDLAALKQLVVDNNFFRAETEYLLENGADLFLYKLDVVQDDLEHTIELNYEAAPLELKEVIDALSLVIQDVASHTLELAVSTSADTLDAGETLTVDLVVENASRESLALLFKSGQMYDFFVSTGNDGSSLPGSEQAAVWNWAADKVFTQAAQTIVLEVGDTMSFSIEWGGTKNSGERIQGDFWIGATLVSTPGGTTPLAKVYLK